MERLEGERRVPDPRVAVVPVPLAARRLRKRGRERGHRRARRHVGEALDRQRRPLHRVAQPVVRDPRGGEPPPPEARRRVDPGLRLVVALRGSKLLGPRERAVRLLAGLEHVPPSHGFALDVDREIRDEPERHTRSGCVGDVLRSVDLRPGGRCTAVVEDRLADEVHLDASIEALDRPHEHVVGVVVGRGPRVRRDGVLVISRTERQRVAYDDPTRRCPPRRLDDVRAGHVRPCRRVGDPERGEAEEAGLAVEEAAEDARGIEVGDAQPVDRAVWRDERSGVAVGQKRVVRDRRERRRCSRALRRGPGLLLLDGTHRRSFLVEELRSRSRGGATRRGLREACPPRQGPTIPGRRRRRAEGHRAAAA